MDRWTKSDGMLDDDLARDAFATLSEDAPSLDHNALWSRVHASMGEQPATRAWPARLLGGLALFAPRSVVAGTAVAALLVVVTISTSLLSGGGRANAAILDSARALSSSATAAFADGELTDDELAGLREGAERLLQLIVEDPSRLERLSTNELSDLVDILGTLEGALDASGTDVSAALSPMRSASGLASTALHGSDPTHHPADDDDEDDEQFLVATAGLHEIVVLDAGSVTLDVQPTGLTIVDGNAASGWTFVIDRVTGSEVQADFVGEDASVRFQAELEDGVLRVRTEVRALRGDDDIDGLDDDDGHGDLDDDDDRGEGLDALAVGAIVSYDASTAGTVTLRRDDDGLVLVDATANDGWVVEKMEQDDEDIDVEFRRDDERVTFHAELEDGVVRVRVENLVDHDESETDSGDDDGHHSGSGSDDDSGDYSGSAGGGDDHDD